jgi:hypothetical protein
MRDTNKGKMIEKIAKEENLPLEVLCLDVDKHLFHKRNDTKNT